MDKKPQPISDLLQGLLKSWGMDRVSKERRVFEVWNEALGQALARHTRPAFINHGRLVIAVRDSAWMQELQFMKEDIRKKLNKTLGRGVIQDIKFKIGSWEDEEVQKPGLEGSDDEIELDPSVIAEAEAAASVIQDPALREQVLKTLLSSARAELRKRSEHKE